MNNTICPICGEGILETRCDTDEVEYRKVICNTPLHYSECVGGCGSQTCTAEESTLNKNIMLAVRAEIDSWLK